jgi:hypothetical protein
MHLLLTLVIALFLLSSNAMALPEAARFGHFTCTSCHVSPGGGGTLTAYGRDFSTKLSTWHYNKEEYPLHGLVPLSDRFLLGGDSRWAKMNAKMGDNKADKFWRMQTDIEATINYGPAWVSYTLGTPPAGPYDDAKDSQKVVTRAFMVRGDFWDDRIIARAGLFLPKYGLMLSDHTAFVRKITGLGPDTEQTQAEVIFQHDHIEATAAVLVESDAFDRDDKSKSGFNLGLSAFAFNRNRVNINMMSTTLDTDQVQTSTVSLGASAIIGMLNRIYGMFEIDRVQEIKKREAKKEYSELLATYSSLNVVIYKGVIPFAQYEYRDDDITSPNSSTSRWGAGFNWYPRPHFHLQGRYLRSIINTSQLASDQTDFILHYYF